MCGFAGFISTKPAELEGLEALATRMASTIAHRGPDDAGSWADAQAGVALGFQRLSIIELSPAGHQPMVSGSERFVIAVRIQPLPHRKPGGAHWGCEAGSEIPVVS